MTHHLKILPCYFREVASGNKTFELRKNDRDFKSGDSLILQEYNGQYFASSIFEVVVFCRTVFFEQCRDNILITHFQH